MLPVVVPVTQSFFCTAAVPPIYLFSWSLPEAAVRSFVVSEQRVYRGGEKPYRNFVAFEFNEAGTRFTAHDSPWLVLVCSDSCRSMPALPLSRRCQLLARLCIASTTLGRHFLLCITLRFRKFRTRRPALLMRLRCHQGFIRQPSRHRRRSL